jgi:hypothetical protein
MTTSIPIKGAPRLLLWLGFAGTLVTMAAAPARGVEMRVSRDAIERTLKQQLFAGPDGRYYIKGSPKSPCFTYAEDPRLAFVHDGVEDRIVVRVKTHSRLGRAVGGTCLGLPISVPAEVSVSPDAEGETIGFRDARLDRVSDQRELNFLLSPFLSRQIPSSMKVNAADLIRKSLADSTVATGYKVTLDRLKIHSVVIDGDNLVVDVDGDLSVK